MALTRARRESWGLLVARLARITGDASLAEDCVQDAFPRAWECWRTGAIPWRRRRLEAQKPRLLTEPAPDADPENDSLLALIFTCAHPALPLEGQVPLTLRWVAGLSTEETARAFFNHGNDAGPEETTRATLAPEALRLARLLCTLLPGEPEPRRLLALHHLTLARRPAAQTDFGEIASLYARLEALSPTPVVRLNRAVARGIADGPGVGLELLDALAVERTLREYTYYHPARASFLDQMGRRGEAREAWTRARELASGEARRAYLARRAEGRG